MKYSMRAKDNNYSIRHNQVIHTYIRIYHNRILNCMNVHGDLLHGIWNINYTMENGGLYYC